jgi:hypothetical protein
MFVNKSYPIIIHIAYFYLFLVLFILRGGIEAPRECQDAGVGFLLGSGERRK